jgi:hypothetical protein
MPLWEILSWTRQLNKFWKIFGGTRSIKKYGNKWGLVVQSTQQIQLNISYLSWREYVLCTGGMILLSVHTCQQNNLWTVQFIIFFVCNFTWALFYFVNKNEPGYSSHWCKVRGLFLTPIYRRFGERTLVWNSFLSIYSFHCRYSLFIYIYPHCNLVMCFLSTIFIVVYSTVQCSGTLLIL